jgi:hypothetical protein
MVSKLVLARERPRGCRSVDGRGRWMRDPEEYAANILVGKWSGLAWIARPRLPRGLSLCPAGSASTGAQETEPPAATSG